MFSKNDIENLKNKLEQLVGKKIIFRYNYTQYKKMEKTKECEGIIESVSNNVLVLRRIINENIGIIESYTFIDILSGVVEIIDIK